MLLLALGERESFVALESMQHWLSWPSGLTQLIYTHSRDVCGIITVRFCLGPKACSFQICTNLFLSYHSFSTCRPRTATLLERILGCTCHTTPILLAPHCEDVPDDLVPALWLAAKSLHAHSRIDPEFEGSNPYMISLKERWKSKTISWEL